MAASPSNYNVMNQTLPEENDPYYEQLLNNPLFQTPPEVGDPESRDNNEYPGELGDPSMPEGESWLDEEEDDEEEYSQGTNEEDTEEEADARRTTNPVQDPVPPGILNVSLRKYTDRGEAMICTACGSRGDCRCHPRFRVIASRKPAYLVAGKKHKAVEREKAHQWSVESNGKVFRSVGRTIASLPAGLYMTDCDFQGGFLRAHTILSDDLVPLPDGPSASVMAGIQAFWSSQDRYSKHGLLFKRGVLLHGAPGTGKSATINMVSQDLIARGGVVIFSDTSPGILTSLLAAVRDTEPDRPIVAVLEDIDATINYYGERDVLALLDGENQIDNICYVATTNYIEKLGARIVNRPSRFDQRIRVEMPTEVGRLHYLRHAAKGEVPDSVLQSWSKDTEGMSISHLKELIIGVLCLGRTYADVLGDLKAMYLRPTEKNQEGFWNPQ